MVFVQGDLLRVEELWDRADYPHHTMIFKATAVDDPEQKEFALEQNAMHVACESGHGNVVAFLKKKGISPCKVDSLGRSSLLIACEFGHLDCAELCIAPDLTWSERPDNTGRTPFLLACLSDNISLVKLLYERGVDISSSPTMMVRSPSGGSRCKVSLCPLAAAVLSGASGVVEFLLRLRVPNAKTPAKCLFCTGECPSGLDGLTPLALARKLGDDRITKLVSADSQRERRATPVKERAENTGVDLPPTPPEARVQSSASPATRAKSKRALQRHQKACQQKVDRAENFFLVEKGDFFIAETQEERRLSRDRLTVGSPSRRTARNTWRSARGGRLRQRRRRRVLGLRRSSRRRAASFFRVLIF